MHIQADEGTPSEYARKDLANPSNQTAPPDHEITIRLLEHTAYTARAHRRSRPAETPPDQIARPKRQTEAYYQSKVSQLATSPSCLRSQDKKVYNCSKPRIILDSTKAHGRYMVHKHFTS